MRVLAAALAALALAGCTSIPGLPLTGHVHGHVTLSPCVPVERYPPAACPPAAGVRVAFGSVAVVTTDSQGDYDVDLPPGDYGVVVEAGIARQPVKIHVNGGDHLTLDLNVDSGIR